MLKEKQIATVIAYLVIGDIWVTQQHVAMALRKSEIDARTYFVRPLTIWIYAPHELNTVYTERTHIRSTSRGSRVLNNAHVLHRKCLFTF